MFDFNFSCPFWYGISTLTNMSRNEKNNRISLSEVFLRPSEGTELPPKSEPVVEKPTITQQKNNKRVHTRQGLSRKGLLALLLATFIGAVILSFTFNRDGADRKVASQTTLASNDEQQQPDQSKANEPDENSIPAGKTSPETKEPTPTTEKQPIPVNSSAETVYDSKNEIVAAPTTGPVNPNNPAANKANSAPKATPIVKEKPIEKLQYLVKSSAYIYESPKASARTGKALKRGKTSAPFNALAEENGFVYVVITSGPQRGTEGWLVKKDLKPVKTLFYGGDIK